VRRVKEMTPTDAVILAVSLLMAVGTLFMELGAWSALTDPAVVGKLLMSTGGVALAFFRETTPPPRS
jgi:hypothetical protein